MDAGVPEPAATAWAAEAPVGDLGLVADAVAKVWRQMPGGDQAVRQAQLAADVLNDAHALDATAILGRVVARLAATVNDLPTPRRPVAEVLLAGPP